MKQTYRKKPEYLECVDVLDDTQSIKDVYEMAGVEKADISFNDEGERVITIGETQILPGMVVFKDKKSDKLIVMPKEKLLQFYDEYTDECEE